MDDGGAHRPSDDDIGRRRAGLEVPNFDREEACERHERLCGPHLSCLGATAKKRAKRRQPRVALACSAIPRLVDLFGVAETIAFFVTLTHRELNGVTGAWSCSALKLKGAKPGRVYVDEVPRSPDDVT